MKLRNKLILTELKILTVTAVLRNLKDGKLQDLSKHNLEYIILLQKNLKNKRS